MSLASPDAFDLLFRNQPVLLAPMEDVSDAVFRRLCREVGADICFTEFVNVDALLKGCRKSAYKLILDPADRPTAVQIYGSDPAHLIEAAHLAEQAQPSFIDLNCGCWIPRIAQRGAGAGWLRNPTAMVKMAAQVVRAVSLPVTVKTRIGLGSETTMPIVELAKRLEGVGVRALSLHCRTAKMGHHGAADWRWAEQTQRAVRIPVIVNGDLRTAEDVVRALRETGCAGAMVGRGAMDHPWIFREARALLDGLPMPAAPSALERLTFLRRQAIANVEERGAPNGVQCLRRHLKGYLQGVDDADSLRFQLNRCDSLEGTLALIDAAMFAPSGHDVCAVPESSDAAA